MTRAGFIGLGSQGAPMARRIVDSGMPLTIWARRPASLEPFHGTAASAAASPAEVGARSDVVGVCVVADSDVREVVLGEDGVLAGMRAGGVIAVHSTVHPDTCRQVAEAAAAAGVGVVDAPVSGGGPAAAEGRLLVMVGGDDEAVAVARPVFATFGDPIIHLGPLGAAQMAKLLNNFVFTAQLAMATDTYSFAAALGIDRAAMGEVLAHGSGGSRAAAILSTSFHASALAGAAGLLDKDVRLMLDVAERAAADPGRLVELARSALAAMTDS